MISGLTPYPAYRDSGVEWLGSVPNGWEVQRTKGLLRQSHDVSEEGTEQLLRVSQYTGVTPRDRSEEELEDSLVGYRQVRAGELVVNIMLAWNGSLGVSSVDGIVSPAYAVFGFRYGNPRYVHYLLRTPAAKQRMKASSRGVVDSRLRLYPDDLFRIEMPLPSAAEQDAIVRYLDHIDSRIQSLIAAKERLIHLLKEEKQAILHRAVTCGLNPDVARKPSGIEWLGDVPAHWELTRIKSEFICLNHRRRPLSSTDRGRRQGPYPYYGASGVIDHVDDYLFDDSLLLVAEDGANLVLRNLPLAIRADGKFWVNNHAHVLKPVNGNLPYLQALMEAIDYRPYLSGAAQPKLTKGRLLSIGVAIPPRAEQVSTMQQLESLLGPQNEADARARQHIDLLREYRTRLISDVVTGKLDIREAARSLPDSPRRGLCPQSTAR